MSGCECFARGTFCFKYVKSCSSLDRYVFSMWTHNLLYFFILTPPFLPFSILPRSFDKAAPQHRIAWHEEKIRVKYILAIWSYRGKSLILCFRFIRADGCLETWQMPISPANFAIFLRCYPSLLHPGPSGLCTYRGSRFMEAENSTFWPLSNILGLSSLCNHLTCRHTIFFPSGFTFYHICMQDNLFFI